MREPQTALGVIVLVTSGEPEASYVDLDPLLQRAIAAGIMTEAQARDVDAFADGILARGRAGELTEEQADELVRAAAQRDGEAELRARERRARERHTVPFDPTWAARGAELTGRTIRQVRLAAQRALERGYTAQTLAQRPQWVAPTFAAALIRTAVRWGLIP